jgi:hypothetical protein
VHCNLTIVMNGCGLSVGQDKMTSVVGAGRKSQNQVRLLLVFDDLESPPLPQMRQCFGSHRGDIGLIVEANRFGR